MIGPPPMEHSTDAPAAPALADLDPRVRKNAAFKKLCKVLDALGHDPDQSLVPIGQWLRVKSRVPAPDGQEGRVEDPRIGRLRLLVLALQSEPRFRASVSAALGATLARTSGVRLFSQTGLPVDAGLVGEAADRLFRRLLPVASDEADLSEFLGELLPREKDAAWLDDAPEGVLEDFVRQLGGASSPWSPVLLAIEEAIALLATRVAALGLADDVRARSPACAPRASPFFRLPRAYDALGAARGGPDAAAAVAACGALHDECLAVVDAVLANLETRGVSIDMVFRLETITKCLGRLETLAALLVPTEHRGGARFAAGFVASLARDRVRDRSVLGLVRGSAHLLSRKIVERAGDHGEHYITETRGDWVKMLLSAGGGGILTAGTTVLKFLIVRAKLAFFLEGLASSLNYAGSFVVMQLAGFTLATKQPSMTAAALAGAIGDEHDERLVTLVARITRSQLAAAIGNIGMVIPAAYGVELASRRWRGAPVLDAEAAEHVLHTLDPIHGATLLWAALTGVFLWFSSVAAGWVDNASVYRQVHEGIARHKLGRFVGRRTMGWLSRWWAHNVSGLGGNVTLGFLLGMTPVLGRFFGVPLDVRHVTLSTGALSFALFASGREMLGTGSFWRAALGIVGIGCLNFGVSFFLALSVALRARNVGRLDRLRLLGAIVRRGLRSPLEFVLPPKSAT